MLAAFGSRQTTTLNEDAIARSSSAIMFMRNVSPSGLDMFMSTARTTYNGPATAAVGLKGIASRKIVESS